MHVLTHSILPFAGILFALIVIHELGHYVTAKLFGVKVLEAGLGYPPRLWAVTWRDTEYSLNALPLGGFVRMLGEEDPGDPQSLAAQVKWKRAIILGSGAAMNLVLAIALFSASQMIPHTVSIGGARIEEVAPGSPAEHAGLQAGDVITKVNGRKASSVEDASYLLRLYQGSHIDLTLLREDARSGAETVTANVYSRWNPPTYTDECGLTHDQGPIGITVGPRYGQNVAWTPEERQKLEASAQKERERLQREVKPGSPAHCYDVPIPKYNFIPYTHSRWSPPWVAIPRGVRMSFESLILARNQVWTWIRGYTAPQVTGPVGIAQATGEVVEQAGWQSLIEFSALLSMNLAVLNILPLPMFDGGRLFFVFVEFVRRGKRIAPEKEALVHLTGLVMILVLAAVITYFDVLRVFRGDSLLR